MTKNLKENSKIMVYGKNQMKPLPIGVTVVGHGASRSELWGALSPQGRDLMAELNKQFGIIFDRGKICQDK